MTKDFALLGTTYRQQYRRCGKPVCATCDQGQGHGPYWYAAAPGEPLRYVGKDLPAKVVAAIKALHDSSADLAKLEKDLRQKWAETMTAAKLLENQWRAVSALRNGGNPNRATLRSLGLTDFADL